MSDDQNYLLRRIGERLEQSPPALAEARELIQELAEPSLLGPLSRLLQDPNASPDAIFRAYEALAAPRRVDGVALPMLRPENQARTAVHVASGLLVAAAILWVPSPSLEIAATCAFVLVWGIEAFRQRGPEWNERINRIFDQTAHPHERTKPNSGTWYVTALFVLAWCFSPGAALVGVAILALADPAASIVGRRFGRHKLRGQKSWVGSATFFVVASGAASLALVAGGVILSTAVPLALAAAVAATVTEALSQRVDDNLTIPLAAALAVDATSVLLG
ncbi:MAG: diacylglycerol/polyprenol kinase family protein [Myxococcota bacterium]